MPDNEYTHCRMCSEKNNAKTKLRDGLCVDCLFQSYKHWREVAHSAVLDHRHLCMLIRMEGLKMRDLVRVVNRSGNLPLVRKRT